MTVGGPKDACDNMRETNKVYGPIYMALRIGRARSSEPNGTAPNCPVLALTTGALHALLSWRVSPASAVVQRLAPAPEGRQASESWKSKEICGLTRGPGRVSETFSVFICPRA